MPRTYKPRAGAKPRMKHSELDLAKATAAIMKGMSYREAQEKFRIHLTVLHRHIKKPDTRNKGGAPTVLDKELELSLVKKLILYGSWLFRSVPFRIQRFSGDWRSGRTGGNATGNFKI